MKKFKKLYIILSICLLFLCGCNDSNISNDNSNANAERMSSETSAPKKEVDLSSFSTNILDKTPNRVYNISLTCNKISNVTIKKGETFSFCDTVGEVSASTGYKEADILDANGKPFKGFGRW